MEQLTREQAIAFAFVRLKRQAGQIGELRRMQRIMFAMMMDGILAERHSEDKERAEPAAKTFFDMLRRRMNDDDE